jgi:predicted phosphoribosyltransferase
MSFVDRKDAVNLLANKLLQLELDKANTIVIAISNGGVVIAAPVTSTESFSKLTPLVDSIISLIITAELISS